MFHYLHCYMPETWEAQVRAGLIDRSAGIRFSQSIDIPEELKFNRLARKGGVLYTLLRDSEMPLYIDRLQGGVFLKDTLTIPFCSPITARRSARVSGAFRCTNG